MSYISCGASIDSEYQQECQIFRDQNECENIFSNRLNSDES